MAANLPAPGDKPTTVRRMFDRIAPRYDRVNRVMTGGMDRGWRRRVVRRLRITPDDTVLDLGCGTGDFAELARGRSRHVIGLDFSRVMLQKARARNGRGLRLVQGDALRLPFGTGTVGVVVSGFALRNFASIPPVLHELARVMKPGGRLGILEVDRPANRVVRGAHAAYFNRVVPLIGGVLSDRGAYRYLPDSVAYLPSEAELAVMLREAGFGDVHKEPLMLGTIQAVFAVRS